VAGCRTVVAAGVAVVFVKVDVICGVVTEGADGAESVQPAKHSALMIRRIVILPICEKFTSNFLNF
jgi:hypothetical protein